MATARERSQRTAEALRVRRASLRRRRRVPKKLPRQLQPSAITRNYTRLLRGYLDLAREALEPLLTALPSLASSAQSELRQDAGEGKRVRELMAAIRAQFQISDRDLELLLQRVGRSVGEFNLRQLNRQLKAAAGIDISIDVLGSEPGISAALGGFVEENVALIKTLPSSTFDRIEQLVTRGFTQGTHNRELTKQINAEFLNGKKRARVIARDQIGKLNGRVNAIRQKNVGITQFIWRTVHDERVRADHEDRDGVTYSYRSPPDGEIPGEPIQCRCYAEPVFDQILARV